MGFNSGFKGLRRGNRNSWREMWAGIDIRAFLQAALLYLFYQYLYNSVCIRPRPKRTLKATSTCDIFLRALFFHEFHDAFPVHRLHNNKLKDNSCVCVCVCVERRMKRWQSPLSEDTQRKEKTMWLRAQNQSRDLPHATESTDCSVATAGACPTHSLTASLYFRIIINYEKVGSRSTTQTELPVYVRFHKLSLKTKLILCGCLSK